MTRLALAVAVTTLAGTAAAAPADPRAWLAARGVTAPPLAPWGVAGCVEQVVGAAHERALSCDEVVEVTAGSRDAPVYRVVTHHVVLVVRAKQLVPVLDVETTLQALDGPPPALGRDGVWTHEAILALDLTIAADGMSATLADKTDPAWRQHESCKRPPVRGADAWAAFDNQWLRQLCSRRGTYVWKAGRFVPAARRSR
ncbi:MAG: hypothetical protein ACM31C_04900 [Acidobacteriota bacterium]